MIPNQLLKAYRLIFDKVSQRRLQFQDLDTFSIHTHLVCTFATAPLMWAYVILAYLTIDSPVPGIVGTLMSTIHLLSIFLFLYSNNILFISSVMLVSGVIHQATFAYFTGGFSSNILIWFGVIPMLGGLIAGRRGVLSMGVLVCTVAFSYMVMKLAGFQFPMSITADGYFIAQILLVFGWIAISVMTIYVFILLRDKSNEELAKSSKKTHTLLRVLIHDIVSPIMVVNANAHMMKKQKLNEEQMTVVINNIEKATVLTMEVIRSVKELYSIHNDNKKLDMILYPVSKAVEYVEFVLAEQLSAKNVKLVCDKISLAQAKILIDPVIFNNQIFLNIISNAVKFSYPNSNIYINAYQCEDTSGLNISIKDEGIGIPNKILNQLFEVDTTTTRLGTGGEKGTGFGLIIMKSFTEKLGGRVTINSTEKSELATGHGTEVILHF